MECEFAMGLPVGKTTAAEKYIKCDIMDESIWQMVLLAKQESLRRELVGNGCDAMAIAAFLHFVFSHTMLRSDLNFAIPPRMPRPRPVELPSETETSDTEIEPSPVVREVKVADIP